MLALVIAIAAALHVTDESRGVGRMGAFGHGGTIAYERDGDRYANGDKSVPASAVEALRAALVASEKQQGFDLRAHGITHEWVRSMEPTMLVRGGVLAGAKRSPEEERVVSFDSLAEDAWTLIGGWFYCDHCAVPNVAVTLDGPKGFAVSSIENHLTIVAWTVRLDGRTWKTYSLDVSHAIAALLTGETSQKLAEPWTDTFLREVPWHSKFERAATSDTGGAKVRAIPGAAAMLEHFEVVSATSWRWLWVVLRPKQPGPFDEVEWYNLTRATSWEPLLRRLDDVGRFLARTKWLARVSRRRRLRLFFSDFQPLAYGWRDAGMQGLPDVELTISGENDSRATILVGPDEQRVVVESMQNMPELDPRYVGPDRSTRYLVGDEDGHWLPNYAPPGPSK